MISKFDFRKKWMTMSTFSLGGFIFCYSIYQIISGNIYFSTLNSMDITTLVMITLLWFRGIQCYNTLSDLKTVSLLLINSLSFIYTFEAIYKFFFFSWLFDPAELRGVIIFTGIALVVLTGFAYSAFRWRKVSTLFLILFIITFAFWVITGYQQLFPIDESVSYHILGMEFKRFPRAIDIELGHNGVYVVNRLAKILLFLLYFSFFQKPKI